MIVIPANAADAGYSKHGANIGAMLFALVVLALLAWGH